MNELYRSDVVRPRVKLRLMEHSKVSPIRPPTQSLERTASAVRDSSTWLQAQDPIKPPTLEMLFVNIDPPVTETLLTWLSVTRPASTPVEGLNPTNFGFTKLRSWIYACLLYTSDAADERSS